MQWEGKIGPAAVLTLVCWIFGGGILYSELKLNSSETTALKSDVKTLTIHVQTNQDRATERGTRVDIAIAQIQSAVAFLRENMLRIEKRPDFEKPDGK